MGETKKWRISHEWDLTKARINNKNNDLQIFICENVVKEVPTTMDQHQFYLVFDALHKEVTKYLLNHEGEIYRRYKLDKVSCINKFNNCYITSGRDTKS